MSQIDGETIVLDSFSRGKHANEKLVVSVREFRGHRFVDLRLHIATPDGFRPTSKGATVRWVELDGVLAALERAKQVMSGGPDPAVEGGGV